ncbi:MAG: phage portal protein [Fuerstiella sp.]
MNEQKASASQLYEFGATASGNSSKNRMAGPGGADGNHQITNQAAYLKSIAFARMMENNDPAVFSAVNRLVNNCNVGQMTPEPDTGSSDLNAKLQEDWSDYASNPELCDHGRKWDYETQADVTFRRVMIDGDLAAIPQEDATVIHLEGHRIQGPTYGRKDRGVCGVEYSGNRPSKYWLTKANPSYGHVVKVSDVNPLDAFNGDGWPNVFHVFAPKMFTLNRGFSALGACGSIGARRDDLEFATVLKAQTANCVTFIESIDDGELVKLLLSGGALAKEDPNEDLGDTYYEADSAGYSMGTADIHPGRVLRPKFGRKLTMDTPNIPGDGQLELNLLLLQYLAMCWDLPLSVLMLDARHANFTTFRGIMDQSREAFKKHQQWFAAAYHRPRYRNWLRLKAQTDSDVKQFLRSEKSVSDFRRSKLFRHKWQAAAWKYYHPVDDAKGDLLQLANGMQTFDQYARKRYGMPGAQLRDQMIAFNLDTYRGILKAKQTLIQEFRDIPNLVINEHFLFPWPSMTGTNLSMSGEPVSAGVEDQGGQG